MVGISDSRGPGEFWSWSAHILVAALIPQVAVGGLGGHFWTQELARASNELRNQALRNQELVDYAALLALGSIFGVFARVAHSASVRIARRVWVLSAGILVFAILYDVHLGFDWSSVVTDYIITLPDAPSLEEHLSGFLLGSFPLVSSVGYALGTMIPISLGQPIGESR